MRKTMLTAVAVFSLVSFAPTAMANIPPAFMWQVGAGRPGDCPRLWCGCWLKKMLSRMGYSTHGASNLARAYAKYGTNAAPGSNGSIMVMRGHVGLVVGKCDSKNVKLLSGNHNHRVGVGCYPMSRAIAWRKPSGASAGVAVKVIPTADVPAKVKRNFNLR